MNKKLIFASSVAAGFASAAAADFYGAYRKNKKTNELVKLAQARIIKKIDNGQYRSWNDFMTDVEFEIIAINNR